MKSNKLLLFFLIGNFIITGLYLPQLHAGEMVMPLMPNPGTRVNLSPAFTPAYLNGIIVHSDNALKFDFLIQRGEGNLNDEQKKQEYNKLIKYFLAALTVPEKNQWVNLSPYEKGRVIQDDFGKTEMGRDLLSQDYLLKQITSSLMFPESGFGKSFWDKVYARAYKEYGTTNIPVNTFNKVWIMPDKALIYEKNNTAVVLKSSLKVMMEEDYVALNKFKERATLPKTSTENQQNLHPEKLTEVLQKKKAVTAQIIKEIILPMITKEVNEGKNFSMLRQVYSGMILAAWYKKSLRESVLTKIYADKAKVSGISQDSKNNEAIYEQYLAAFKKGVYNYVKEDTDQYTHQIIPRKYFAGGFSPAMTIALQIVKDTPVGMSDAAMDSFSGSVDKVAASLERRSVFSVGEKIPLYPGSSNTIDFTHGIVINVGRETLTIVQHSNVNNSPVYLVSNLARGWVWPLGDFQRGDTDHRHLVLENPDLIDPTEEHAQARKDMRNIPANQRIAISLTWGNGRITITNGFHFAIADTSHQAVFDYQLDDEPNTVEDENTRLLTNLMNHFSLFARFRNKGDSFAEIPFWFNAYGQIMYVGELPSTVNAKFSERLNLGRIQVKGTILNNDVFVPQAIVGFNFVNLHEQQSRRAVFEGSFAKNAQKANNVDVTIEGRIERNFKQNSVIGIGLGNVALRVVSAEMYGRLVNESIGLPGDSVVYDVRKPERHIIIFPASERENTEVRLGKKHGVLDFPELMQQEGVKDLHLIIRNIDGKIVIINGNGAIRLVYQRDAVIVDKVSVTQSTPVGGIDFDSANMSMDIKKEGAGIVFPLMSGDISQLQNISGFEPSILDIKPMGTLPIFEDFKKSP